MAAIEILFYSIVGMVCIIVATLSDDENWMTSVGLTGMLVVSWAGNVAFWMLSSLKFWPISSDALLGIIVLIVFVFAERKWVLTLSVLFFFDFVLDALSLAHWIGYTGWAMSENAIYVLQLIVASFPGWAALMGKATASAMNANPVEEAHLSEQW